nr:MAG TPA: hypothetical protein [Caudoviricetes sp.]
MDSAIKFDDINYYFNCTKDLAIFSVKFGHFI